MKALLFASVLALSLLAIPLAATAQERGEQSLMDTVIVTTGRTTETFREISQAVTVIPNEVFVNSAGRDLSSVLSDYGIQINYQNNRNYGNAGITMRGFSTSTHGNDIFSNVLVLIDGRRAGMDSVGIMGLGNIERVEIIHGPGSVQYGAAGMGGVVN
ncbi:MAG: TonB-dependent receptor plug domain-containing protein, partial [Deltaproteobacteria bacterium]|nr:TonB-dependent receptor plug domain-containing protein [Deltaproteobacteria bacterium]